MLNDVTIVLQGRTSEECFNLWLQNYSDYNVVISTWTDCAIDFSKIELPAKWRLIKTTYPYTRLSTDSNLDYQLITTLGGLYEARTKWVIKMRLDEYWSNMQAVYDKMLIDENKIVCGSMFFRPMINQYPWHISDHIMGGTVDNMKLMFEKTLHNLEIKLWDYPIPECHLGLAYVMAKDSDLDNLPNISNHLKKVDFSKSDMEVKVIVNKTVDVVVDTSVKILTDSIIEGDTTNWKEMHRKLLYAREALNESIDYVETRCVEYIDYAKYLPLWFDIIDVNELKPYIATQAYDIWGDGPGRIWYRSEFDNKDCITHF